MNSPIIIKEDRLPAESNHKGLSNGISKSGTCHENGHENNGSDSSGIFELNPPVICPPQSKPSNLMKFQRYVEETYNLKFDNYWDLHKWSTENIPDFWEGMWKFFKVVHSVPYTEVFDTKGDFCNMRWFKGGRLNYAENALKYRDSRLAIVTANENGDIEHITYAEMYEEVKVYASALKALGVQIGDHVTCLMSNRKEAIFAFFAVASIGAIWSGCLPSFAVKSIVLRAEQVKPKILFTIDRFVCEGIEYEMLEKITELEKALPSLEKIIVVRNDKRDAVRSSINIPKSVWIEDFRQLADVESELVFEQLPFDQPMTVSYTSGTTGKPKALLHSAGAFLAVLRDFSLHNSCTRDDVILHISPCGWISWNMFTSALHVGLTVCLYDGSPYTLTPTSYWDVVEKFKITYAFLPASILEEFRNKSYLPREEHTLRNLRILAGSCSYVKPQLYDFVMENIIRLKNPNIHFSSQYGCTEAMGFLAPPCLDMPVHRGELQIFGLGIDAKCIDEEGNYVMDKRGELVIAKPTPTFPICLLGDPDKTLFRSSYLSKHSGNWNLSDECWINPVTRGFLLLGRSDEVMKSNGERINSSDIYCAIDDISEVSDSLCVSQINEQHDERVILFIKIAPGYQYSSKLEQKIRDIISTSLTPDYVPSIIMEAPEIPYNFSGKKMELLVKKVLNKKFAVNREVLVNPSSINFYQNLTELLSY